MLLLRLVSSAAERLARALAVAAILAATPRAGRAEDALSNAQVTANLMEIVFGSEFVGEDSASVRKWTAPVRLAIYARDPTRYRGLVEPVLRELHVLTGLDIRLV